ncbi:TPA: hypothetical protein ACPWJ6_004249 [Pseudomonas aeruginosa]
MSEVKRLNFTISKFESVVPYASEHGQYVRYTDYTKLAAEAQALREEVEALKHSQQVLIGSRNAHRDERDAARKEVAALRARVVVVPDASAVYAALDARERLFTSPENIQVALEAQSRLNGKTVSEGLLREVARHLGNWLELHECECDGGFHYCGRDQVAKTNRELRALLGEGKEVSDGV